MAFGIAKSENGDSWTLFLEILKEAIGTSKSLMVVFDQQKGLEEAAQ